MPTTSPAEQNMNIAPHSCAESPPADASARIRALNDAFRRSGRGGRVLMTAGVAALPTAEQLAAVDAVMRFEAFGRDDDPYGEHDFGAMQLGQRRLAWKIDTYDRSGRIHSPDPADPAVTLRVLTVMLAEEW